MSNLMTLTEPRMTSPSSSRPRPAYEATIERIFEHTFDTRSFFLQLPHGQRFTFKPGQFISLQLPVDDTVLTRPYSLASNPEEGNLLEICLNLVPNGPGSHYLFARELGEALRFTGPWGTFVLDQPPEAECVFIADGTGIAPIRSMLHRVLTSGPRSFVQLLYSAPKEGDLLYRQEWEAWARDCHRFTFVPLLSNPAKDWSGLQGSLLEYMEQRYVSANSDRSRHFYICGVGQQVIQLRDLLRHAGYQRRTVQYEKW